MFCIVRVKVVAVFNGSLSQLRKFDRTAPKKTERFVWLKVFPDLITMALAPMVLKSIALWSGDKCKCWVSGVVISSAELVFETYLTNC